MAKPDIINRSLHGCDSGVEGAGHGGEVILMRVENWSFQLGKVALEGRVDSGHEVIGTAKTLWKLISKRGVANSLEGEDHTGEGSRRGEGVLEVLAGVEEGGHEDGEDNCAKE